MYRHWRVIFFIFRNCLTQTLTLTLDLGHRVRTKWNKGPNLTTNTSQFYRNFTAMRFLRYNSVGFHFQKSRVVLNDSAVKNGWSIVFSKIFRHKQGSNEQKTEKKHIFQYLNGGTSRLHAKLWTDKNMDGQKDGHICHPKKHVFFV